MCQNTTMRVSGAWIQRYCVLCSKRYNTLHSCHNSLAGSRQAARGARICETSLLKQLHAVLSLWDQPIVNSSPPPGQNGRHFAYDTLTCMLMNAFWFEFRWSLFLKVQLTISQHWFRYWLGIEQATSHYLNQCLPSSLTYICGNNGRVNMGNSPGYRPLWNMVCLTYWGRDKMDAISQTTFSSAFYWMKMYELRLKIHWSLFLRVQLTIFQHWFR